MGWDAISSFNSNIRSRAKQNLSIKKKFIEASEYVKKITGSVDGDLSIGALDCSPCHDMLIKAAKNSDKELNWGLAWSYDGMNPDVVKVMHAYLNWDFKFSKEDAWAYYSAKEFVRICAENELSIRFTY
ncbi:hypothetical protein [Sphingobacterium sp.]|uniref:hypothetical protein n=1 Tax=Sphingobacterium sp. TaxID=341027 RepID=UPI002FD8EB26